MPSMWAPILPSRRQMSWTCGSRAALKISVRPSASTAASRMFSVPVTVGRSNTMRSPCSRSTWATISVAVSSMWAPIWRKPRRCCSTRRAPMSSPPGRGKRAWPNRPSIAPRRTIVARMRRPSSSGTSVPLSCPMRRTTEPSPSDRPPSAERISAITAMSVTWGTLLRRTGSDVRSAAAISGRAAFLEPLTHRSPASCEPPVMRSAKSRPCPGAFIIRNGTGASPPPEPRCASVSGPRCVAGRLDPAGARQPEPRLRNREGGLELDFFGRSDRARQLLLRALASLFRSLERDFLSVLGHVREDRHALRKHLEEAAANEQQLLGPTHHLLNAERAGLEHGHQWRVTSHDAELSVGPVGDDELDLSLEEASLDADHAQRVLQLTRPTSFSYLHPARVPPRWCRPCRKPAREGRRACPRGSP